MRTFYKTARYCVIFHIALSTVLVGRVRPGQEKDFNAYPDHVAKYFQRIDDEKQQPLTSQSNRGTPPPHFPEPQQNRGLPNIPIELGFDANLLRSDPFRPPHDYRVFLAVRIDPTKAFGKPSDGKH